MAHWYHMDRTHRDGTVWRSTSPIASLAACAEWIETAAAEQHLEGDVVSITFTRYEDPAPEPTSRA